jgi:hypothetical protein
VVLTQPADTRPIRRRTRKDPKPRFKAERGYQLDGVRGCPALALPQDHPAREVERFASRFDVSALEAGYSSLGRHGYHPRNVLAVWLFASQIGLHHATKVARACVTDAAFSFLSGGHALSAGTLKRFRQSNRALFSDLLTETVRLAHADGLIRTEELATDSMRLRAHASTHAVRTVKRSKKRLEELEAVDSSTLSPELRTIHEGKLAKHRAALEECAARDRTSIVLTNPDAALMKFPSGAGLPGHRITATASGVSERIIIGVLVDAAATDDGKLESALRGARGVLEQAGVPIVGLQAAADAGYFCETDLEFASKNRDWVDVLIAEGSAAAAEPSPGSKRYFSREHFHILDDGTATCPAGKAMSPPSPHHSGRTVWTGIGCGDCPMRSKCTPGNKRSLTAQLNLEKVRDDMRRRMAEPGARARYGQRIATIEPVFSNIEDVMGYRRASSRHPTTIVAEVLLKVVAHNLSRIAAARRLACVWVPLDVI